MGFNLLYHITLLIAYNFQSSLFSIFFSAEQNFAQLENLKAVTGYIFLMSNIYRATHSKHSRCVEAAYSNSFNTKTFQTYYRKIFVSLYNILGINVGFSSIVCTCFFVCIYLKTL